MIIDKINEIPHINIPFAFPNAGRHGTQRRIHAVYMVRDVAVVAQYKTALVIS